MKNEFYTNASYFLNGQYSDKVLSDFRVKAINENYACAMQTQSELNHSGAQWFPMTEFKVDRKTNLKYNLPEGTYTLKTTFELPIKDIRKFKTKYGTILGAHIPLSDTLLETNIFNCTIACVIGEFRCMDVMIIPLRGRINLIAIPPNVVSAEEVEVSQFYTSILYLWYERRTTTYYTSMVMPNDIPIEEQTCLLTLPRDCEVIKDASEGNNSWDVYITKKDKLLAQSVCYVKEITSSNITFAVDLAFLNYITASTKKLDFYFIRRPNRYKCILFDTTNDNYPIISTGFVDNPIGKKSIIIYDYDAATARKRFKIEDSDYSLAGNQEVCNHYAFPDIYDFSTAASLAAEKMLIEVYEYPIWDVLFSFDNHASDFMNNIGSKANYDMIVGSNGVNAISDYNPQIANTSHEDYLNSEYYGDIRGYLLSKLDVLLASDPFLYNKLTKFIDSKNIPTLTEYHTAASLKMTNRTVTDNAEVANLANDSITTFDNPQRVLKYRTSESKSPCLVYLAGAYKNSTYEYGYKNDMYIYMNADEIDLLDATTLRKPITIDVFTKASKILDEGMKDHFKLDDLSSTTKIFEESAVDTIKLTDLIFYNTETGEIYPLEYFIINLSVRDYIIQNPVSGEEFKLTTSDIDVEYLITKLKNLFVTTDGEFVILKESAQIISSTEIEDLYPNGIKDITHKELDVRRITVQLANPSLIGVDITVAVTGNQFINYTFDASEVVNGSVVIENVLTTPNLDKYEVYADGKLLTPAEYNIEPHTKIGGTMYVQIMPTVTLTDKLNIVHVPVDYDTFEIEYDFNKYNAGNFLSDEYVEDLIWENGSYTMRIPTSITNGELINLDKARIFLNGYRVSLDLASQYKVSNILHFTKEEVENELPLQEKNNRWIIKNPSRDFDIYKMEADALENQIIEEISSIPLPPK